MARRRFRHEDYGVGWVCALPVELAAAQVMLDEEHAPLGQNANDTNLYTLGQIGEHNVVIACLPAGQMGTNSAAAVAIQMKSTFKSVRFSLMIGIGGGVPSAEADIRLGDVVVSLPHRAHGGVVQYDSGKTTPSGIELTGALNIPPTILLYAVSKIQANHLIGRSKLSEYISSLSDLPVFACDNAGSDVLFEASYDHTGGATCDSCSKDRVIERQPRGSQDIVVHYGTIASGNQVMRDGATRDRVSTEFGGVLCFEMEAAGLMNSFPCLVIRGICDYADSHKNKKWQAYAAGTAAAYAKELLSVIPPAEVVITPTIDETTEGKNGHIALPAVDFMSPLTLPNIIERPEWRMLLSKSKIAANDLFERLSDYDYQRAYRWRRNRKLENTTGWILKHSDFLAWLGGKGPQCLWLSGIVGCGKSTTMTTVIEATVENAQSVSRPVFQFIYDYSFRRHLTARALFESYAKQLLVYMERSNKACPSTVITRILEFYGPKRRRPDVQELIVEVLIPLTKMVEATGATFLVDGVDECSQQEALQVLWGLRQLLKSRLCRVFISCREEVNVLQGIPGANRIWITAKDTKADLEIFVDNEIKRRQQDRSISSNEAVLNNIRYEIQNKADGMFLWAQYQIKMLWENCAGGDLTDEVVHKTLKMLPKDLNETYEQCLVKLNRDSKRKSLADRILKWICVSLEPFKVIQLQEALAVNPDTGELGQDLIHKEEIMTCCASLAFLEKDGTEEFVHLAHHSVRQFLFPLGAESTYRIAQVELGELCVIYLYRHRPVKQLIGHAESSRKSIETLPTSISYGSTIGSVIAPGIFKSLFATRSGRRKSVTIRFPKPISRNAAVAKETGFLSYAKTNWMLLTPNLSPASRHWSSFKNLALLNDPSWDIYPWPQRGYHSLDLHIFQLYGWSIINSHYALLSIAIGQQEIVRRDIFNLPVFDQVGQRATLPLPAAATTGDTEIVASLLKIMPKVNEQHSYALHAASSKGYLEVVRLLLKVGTPVNTTAGYLGSALEAARRHGHDQVVQCLVDAGPDSNLHTLKGHTDLVRTVAFSPDSQVVASGSEDATIRLWDAKTGTARHTLKGHTDWVQTVAFSPDGQLVASGSGDATIRLWDAKSGAARHTLKGHTDLVRTVAFSPDSQVVASGSEDETIRLWDAKTGVAQHTLKGHTNWVRTVAFSPDGQLVASGSEDATIRLWDAKSGAARHTLKGHTDLDVTVAFSPDGQLVASGSDDATMGLWDAETTLFSSTPRTLREQIQPVAHSYEGSTALESWLRAPVDQAGVQVEKFDEIDPVTSMGTSEGDEIQSVLSGIEDILSSASSHRTSHKAVAERQIATFIADNQYLLLMFDEAMKAMPKDRFVQNFRRLLKRYYIDICEHTKNDLERETVRLLRSRGSRLRIAKMVADIRNPGQGDREPQFDEQIRLAHRKDQEYLEDWVSGILQFSPHNDKRMDPALEEPFPITPQRILQENSRSHKVQANQSDSDSQASEGDSMHSASNDSQSDKDEQEGKSSYELPNMQYIEEFLGKSSAFQNLSTNLGIFVLPYRLRSLAFLSRSNQVRFSTEQGFGVSDKLKAFIERQIGASWIWWPLRPRVPSLGPEETRIYWQCSYGNHHYTEASTSQADIIKQLSDRQDTPSQCIHMYCKVGRKFGILSSLMDIAISNSPLPAKTQRYIPSKLSQSAAIALTPRSSTSSSQLVPQAFVAQYKPNMSRRQAENESTTISNTEGEDNSMVFSIELQIPGIPVLLERVWKAVFLHLRFPEPVCPLGKERIRWQCKCGVRGFGDVAELTPGGITTLKYKMEQSAGVKFVSASNFKEKFHPQRVIRGTVACFQNLIGNARARLSQAPALPQHNPQPTSATQGIQNPVAQQQTLHVMSCMHKNRYGKNLCQDRIDAVNTDKKLFIFLNSQFMKRRGNFMSILSLRAVQGIIFVKFRLSMSGNVEIRYHEPCCNSRPCECLPSEDIVEPSPQAQYRCKPGPPAIYPPILPDYLLHLFTSPSCINENETWILSQLPKRTCGQLHGTPDQPAEGWGIFYQEGWDMLKIVWLFIILFILGSLVFGVLWSIYQNDVQGAFGISAWWVTAGGSMLALLAIRSANE